MERECRNSLQSREVQLKEQITSYKLEIKDLLEERKQKDQLKQDLDAITTRYLDSERTLEELGMQLSTSKLQISEMKEKQRPRGNTGSLSSPEVTSDPPLNTSWTPDKMVSQCKGCNREFSMTRRKHHCRNCGHIFCNNCSDHMLALPSSAAGDQSLGKPVRVCDGCWDELSR